MDAFGITYALSRQVPAMERGFAICTGYGELVINDGPMADRIQALVRQELEAELARLDPGQAGQGEVRP
ncbi:hypothetical protein [Acidovorax sp.]|uniref:hypothetical protein n=1 Tax=Acidovorax sp. TaxID=1872122 RepID=UPI002ACDFB9D|nr:hypothetical protein [Acidovorax sp.]MDZ7862649.1 hypothetical protein [Acidovorax sp.]